jgi:hypothetical protein
MDPGGSVARPDRRHSRDHAIKFFGGDRPTDAAKRISECDQGRFDMCAQRSRSSGGGRARAIRFSTLQSFSPKRGNAIC